MPVTYPGVQYSGIWNLSSQANAKAAGTWPRPPGAPTIGTATAGSSSASVTFTAPTDLGIPATITGYIVTSSPGGFTGTGSSSPITVSGLTNGTAYTFTVTATNSTGTGPASATSNSVTPAPQPVLFIWGYNSYGQLGLGNTTHTSSPTQVGSSNWSQVTTNFATLAVNSSGSLWAWGKNTSGELGLGNTTNRSSPVQVGSLTNWSKVFCSTNGFSLAIKTDGTLWAWGVNTNGQLGLGNTTAYSSPKQIGALTNWLSASPGYLSTIAVKTNGTLWAWGNNDDGQLGLGDSGYYARRSSPTQIGALTNWASIANRGDGNSNYNVAIKTDGTLWSWGNGGYGALGLGNNTNYSSPKQVGGDTNWALATIGSGQVLAVKTNGTLWSWGRNNSGQLGLGDTVDRSSPVQIGALTSWLLVSAGSGYASMARKTDGTLWTWGQNTYGALGIGNTTNYSSPKQVGALTTWTNIGMGGYSAAAIATI